MPMTIKSIFVSIVTLALLGVAPAFSQENRFAKTTIEATDLGGGVYMMTGAGGNLGLSAGADGAFLIDDQFAPLSAKIKTAIGKVSTNPVRFLVNTHWHYDHTGGNANFGTDGAIIVAQDNVRKRLSTDQFIKAFKREIKASPVIARPIITFTDEISFYQNGQDIHVFHVKNAHTDGDAFVYFEQADVLHMGDVLFNKMYPFIDTGSGGSINGMIAAQERALALVTDTTKIIPGHGPLGDRQDLADNFSMLKAVRVAVLAHIAKGDTADETVAADPLADLNAKWGNGFMKAEPFVRIVYADLAGK
jgi:cyclase